MLRRRPRHSMLTWVRQPVVVWLLLAALYLTSAVLSILLALAMTEWWPLLLTLASMLAAATCAMTALDHRPQRTRRTPSWMIDVTIAVGIFDLFGYTIPGSLYLALLTYAATRLDWLTPTVITQTPVLLVAIVFLLLSYLLGYLTYPLGALANRLVPHRRDRRPRQEFVRRNPTARDRDFVQADPFLLLSGIQLHDKDVATDIIRLRAAGLMLRNAAPPLALAFLTALLELFLSGKPFLAATSAILLGAGFFSLIIQGRRFGYWASLKTLELSFWLPDVDEKFK